jgi:hypothetical protein
LRIFPELPVLLVLLPVLLLLLPPVLLVPLVAPAGLTAAPPFAGGFKAGNREDVLPTVVVRPA